MKRAALLLLLFACGSKQREEALRHIASPSAKERASAVRALSGSGDEESWAALVRAARDGSAAVRAEAAAALLSARREDAPDAVAPLLGDPDDSVRIATVRALGKRCGERETADLRLAFARSGAAVRAEAIEALRACGSAPQETLAREEAERRRRALAWMANSSGAQRARGIRELALLCRDEDRARILPLLDDKDGVVVAAAARGLGECPAPEAAPRLATLLDEGGEIAAAAAEALAALGAPAVAQARARLEKLAVLASDEAIAAAAAIAPDCAVAPAARNARAAALLAVGCPAAPFARALIAAADPGPLYEALLQAKGPAPGLDKAIAERLRKGAVDARIPPIAQRYGIAGPALVEALRREQAARVRLVAQQAAPAENDSAAEIAKAPAPGVPDRERYERLMARLRERQGAEDARASAAARFDALLRGDRQADRRAFIAAALRAALALGAPGAGQVAAGFGSDPDPAIAAAARGDLEPPPPKKTPAVGTLDARTTLWSDEGSARAEACAALAGDADPAIAAARRALAAADPERRVRASCQGPGETAPGK